MQYADPTLILFTIAGIAYLVMLVIVLKSRTVREKSIQALLTVNLGASLGWVILQTMSQLQALGLIHGFDLFALQRASVYFLIVIGLMFFQLTRRFLRKTDLQLGWWLAGAGFLAGAVLLYENPLRLPDYLPAFNGQVFVRWLAAFDLVVLGWGLFMGGALFHTLADYRKTLSPLHRNRNTYWLLALGLAVAGDLLTLLRLPLPGNLLHLLAVGEAVYALLTYAMPDLRMAGRRTASTLILTVLTIAVYTGGFYLTQLIFKSAPGYNPLLVGAILAALLALLFNPLLNILSRFVNRLITGVRYDPRQTLSEYSKSISNVLDMDVLATISVGLISEAIEITHGALVIVRYEADPSSAFDDTTAAGMYHLRSISGLGQELPEGILSPRNPVVYYLRREHHPLTQYDIDLLPRFQVMEPEERAWLSHLKMDVYVPIYTQENWIGMLALGPKVSGDRYFDEDLAFLQTLADQTAVALENARLYDDLKQRNADNERLNVELKNANAELARLDRAKSDFINIASHELRTPLTQVIGYNDILGEMIKADQLQQSVGAQMTESVRKAARRLEEIVETMFDVSKLDTKTLDLMRAPVSLSSVITVAIDTWSKGAEERKQSIAVRGIANLPTVMADGKRLTQVFSHLIQNAIKSTPDGGQIRITGRVIEEPVSEGVEVVSAAAPVPALAAAGLAASSANGGPAVTVLPGFAAAGEGALSSGGNGAINNGGAMGNGGAMNGGAMIYGSNGSNGSNGSKKGGSNGVDHGEVPTTPRGSKYVEIIISDTGIGIAQEDLERIFEKFYRVGNVLLHSTGDTKFKGAGPGLGLTIARGIIEAHGGRIWAESPGHDEETCPGSKFHVLIPVKGIAPN